MIWAIYLSLFLQKALEKELPLGDPHWAKMGKNGGVLHYITLEVKIPRCFVKIDFENVASKTNL